MFEAIGYVGAVGSASMWAPQAARVVRLRHDVTALAGISASAYAIAVVFNALLVVYGSHAHALPVVVAGVTNLACATLIFGMLQRSRRRAA
ncbi:MULTISPECIES: hypothetical protein [unclassified Nocardioides]|uniref:hypothetical protein n=1 Tax=unclassified Nocardioides TaxID=2615069 RepID=UPI000700D7BF|nr:MULTISPECIES: hypothetical protein [unclassified Nocardioides]KRA29471.1 hypothetical protein ASD81_21050 [Nocardioides sp. Root614]KRA88354.1 hypothetical protein ASD84_20565 [Nocardioides sp. Root682]